MRRSSSILAAGLLAPALLVSALPASSLPEGPTRAGAAPGAEAAAGGCDARCVLVEVTVAADGSFTPSVVITGSVAAKYQSNVAFRTGGRIAERLVEVGAHVGPDEVLARLDPRDQQAGVDQARAALASAQALLAQAQVNFARQEKLYAGGYATRPAYDMAQQQQRTQGAAVASARAALGTAEEQLGYAELKAGVAGVVVGRDAEAGQVVQAGQTVFTLAQDGARDAVFDVYESLLTEPPANGTVAVALQSDPAVRTTGRVREIAPTVDDASGAVKVKVALDQASSDAASPGASPKFSLGAAVVGSGSFKPRRAVVLPRGALFRWQDSPAVWLYDAASATVAPRPVEVMTYDGAEIVLSGGVRPGESVVTAGTQFLHPGQRVGIAKREAPPAPRTPDEVLSRVVPKPMVSKPMSAPAAKPQARPALRAEATP